MKSKGITIAKREYDAPEGDDGARQILAGENDAATEGLGRRIHALVDRIGDVNLAAHAAGVSVSTLRRYMRDDVAAPFAAMAGLARRSGVSLDWLAWGGGETAVAGAEVSVPPSGLVAVERCDDGWGTPELATILAIGAAVQSLGDLPRAAQVPLVLRIQDALRALAGGRLPDERELTEADIRHLAELASALGPSQSALRKA